jgi:anaerobic dimethyl sulfoxide reductase subunit B (iron-sulfur subunit)
MSSTTSSSSTSKSLVPYNQGIQFYSGSGPVVFQTGVQYGFFFDQGRCTGCRDCTLSCKIWYDDPVGPVKRMRCYQYETGAFPNIRLHFYIQPCWHCQNPVCVQASNGAMFKEPKYGAVLIDPAQANSANLKAAWDACPYGAIVFDSNSPASNAFKCTMCIDRLEQGMMPVCVTSCRMRALEFGPLATLESKYGTKKDLPDVPSSTTTNPSVIFNAQMDHTQVVPYDSNAALTLWQGRGPFGASGLPNLFNTGTDVTGASTSIVGRNKLVLKHSSVEELEYYTVDDE